MIEKVKPLLIALGVIKRFAKIPLYLQVIPLFLGGWQIVSRPQVIKLFFPLISMIFLNLAFSWQALTPISVIVRNFQLLLLIFFSHYCYSHLNDQLLRRLLRLFLAFAIVYFLAELVFTSPYERRFWFGFGQYMHLVGEPNFSAFLFLGLFLIGWLKKWKLEATAFAVLGILTYSRSFVVALLAFFLLIGIRLLLRRINTIFTSFALGLVLLSPLVTYGVAHLLSSESLQWLHSVSSQRFSIHLAYLKLTSLFGTGYFNGFSVYQAHQEELLKYLQSFYPIATLPMNEMHSLFIQTWVEFGVVGFSLFVIFIVLFYRSLSPQNGVRESFVALLVFSTLLNIYNEVVFWLFLGAVLKNYSTKTIPFFALKIFERIFRSKKM